MAFVALALAAAATAGAALPGLALYVGMGAGLLAVPAGLRAFRAREARASRRLTGAAASALGALAVGLCAVRFAALLAALDRLEQLVG